LSNNSACPSLGHMKDTLDMIYTFAAAFRA